MGILGGGLAFPVTAATNTFRHSRAPEIIQLTAALSFAAARDRDPSDPATE
jgi:hypothetical protein